MSVRELLPGETALAFEAMRELRPRLDDATAFVERIDTVQRPEGYRLAGAFEADESDAVAVAGFRMVHMLAWGRAIYIDDLSTRAAARRRGHADALFAWVLEEARRLGSTELHLDSGVGPDREDAHRFYLRHRMRISSHHFHIKL